MRVVKNPGITLALRYKKSGGTKEEGWRDAELAMSLMERQRLADKVWR